MQTEQFQLHAEIEQRHWWFVARRAIVRRLVEATLPAGVGHTIIDVGCGTGANIAALADGYRTIGIDASSEAIALARGRFPQVEFHSGFAPDGIAGVYSQADLVMLNDVMEHVADDYQLLESLVNAAKPGCYFLLTVPADMALWSPHDVAFGHYRRYDLARFRETWTELPVRELLATSFNTRLYPLVRWIRRRNHRRDVPSGAAGTDFAMPPAFVNRGLRAIFESEGKRLLRGLRGSRLRPRHGVSLIAMLRRDGEARQSPMALACSEA